MATGEKDISCASSSLDSFWNMFIISLDSFECLGESDGRESDFLSPENSQGHGTPESVF